MLEAEAACTACPLYQTATHQLLTGVGPARASIMLVGEAPGKTEDKTGIPFVGESGRLLDTLLAQAGLRRDDVFVTNGVRCRPIDSRGNDRKPSAREVKACRPHLVREVAARQPDIIITLGNEALKSVTGMSGIKEYRGVEQKARPEFASLARVFPTFHPAFALREPAHEQEIVQDIQTAARSLQGGFREIDATWSRFSGTSALNTDIPLWSFDIETNARDLSDPELEVRFLAIDDGTTIEIFVGDAEVRYATELMQHYIRDDRWLVGHNASAFDRAVLKEKYGINLKVDDTQLLAHKIDEEQPLKLQDLAVKYLGIRPWKDGFDVHFWRRGPQTEEEWQSSITYCARDTRYDRLLFVELWSLADDLTKRLYRRHLLPCSRALAQTERNGAYISVENAHRAISQLDLDARTELLMLKAHTDPKFNPGSHQQVREVLYSDLMLPVVKRIKGSSDASTDEEALQQLRLRGVEPEIVGAVLKFRENTKLLSVARDYLERATKGYTDKNGIFHANLCSPVIFPRYSMTSTVNDRTSSFNPNLQNVPRDKRVRSIIAAPPGYVLIEADYSQLELRMAAELAGPKSALWQEYQKPKPDVHMTMAVRLTGKREEDVTEEERSRAKAPNFAYLYYADWPTYQRLALTDHNLVVSEREARFAEDAFKEWGVQAWWTRIIEELDATGAVVSIFGSKRRLPNVRSRDKYARLEAQRMGINFSDASPSSHLVQLALAQLVGRGFYTTGYIHDAVHIIVPNDPETIAQSVAAIKYDMEVTTLQLVEQIFGYRFSVPMVADVKVCRAWGQKV